MVLIGSLVDLKNRHQVLARQGRSSSDLSTASTRKIAPLPKPNARTSTGTSSLREVPLFAHTPLLLTRVYCVCVWYCADGDTVELGG